MTLRPEDELRVPRRPFGRTLVPVLTGSEASAFDRWAIDEVGVPSPVLIEAAGRGAAQLTQRAFPDGRVAVVVGSGNNGGDALVVGRTLSAWGRDVVLIAGGSRPDVSLLHGWPLAFASSDDERAELRGAAVVVDGLLGTGLKGPPRTEATRLIQLINESDGRTVALDIPSGVHADDGSVATEAVRADLTIGFGSAKLGTVLSPGREYAGRLLVTEIGFPPDPEPRIRFITPEWAAAARPVRDPAAHKNSVGAVCVVAGKEGMAGAALLAAQAALRAGAGYVRVVSHAANREIVQQAQPGTVFVDRDDQAGLRDAIESSAAVLAGPGMGTDGDAARVLAEVMSHRDARPLVLDADALTLLATSSLGATGGGGVLLTPHLGEMARLTDRSVRDMKRNPLEAAQGLSTGLGVSVLLKGRPTVVATPEGHVWIASGQSSDLAVAGMGDTLAGVAASLAAQGLDVGTAGAVAIHATARAATLAARGAGMVPSDVVEWLPDALMESGPGDSTLEHPDLLFDSDPPR